jgi:3-hydroxyisobutyrate dehydrogenase-like beta-hydroxyacid dehydrogenase
LKEESMRRGEGETVGLIGLGTMGSAIAARLVAQGQLLTIFDVDDAAMQRVLKSAPQAHCATSIEDVARRCSIVLCSLAHPDILADVVTGPAGLRNYLAPNSIVVDVSTSGPSAVQKCEAQLRGAGCSMVDAAIARGPAAALRGELIFMVGGDADPISRVEPVLNHLAVRIVRCGPLGSGQAIKLANNLVACANLAVIAEAYDLAKSHGCDPKLLLSIMQGTYADSFQLQHSINNKAIEGNFDIVFRLDLAAKDMELARQALLAKKQRSAFSGAALEWFDAAISSGYGKLDWSAVLAVAEPSLTELTTQK